MKRATQRQKAPISGLKTIIILAAKVLVEREFRLYTIIIYAKTCPQPHSTIKGKGIHFFPKRL